MVDATVTIGERVAPAQAVPALPKGRYEITTEDGKRIVATENLTVLEEMDLSAAINTDHQSNPTWMSWATIAANVRMIDGDVLPMPRAESEVRSIIARVGDDGMRQMQARWAVKIAAARTEMLERAKN